MSNRLDNLSDEWNDQYGEYIEWILLICAINLR